jgi:hypothetical protein
LPTTTPPVLAISSNAAACGRLTGTVAEDLHS